MAITIKDIAAIAKVSKGTVSRVINGVPGVGEKTRKRILKLIKDLDYQPNASAQGLAANRTDNIGMIIPHTGGYSMSGLYWPVLLTAITEKAAARGINVLLSTAKSEEDIDSAYKTVLKGRRVDGLIVGAEQFGEKHLAELLFKDFPFVMVGKSPFLARHFVDVDNEGGARDMTRHLIKLGHKNIAMLAGPEQFLSVKERVRGFESAMNEAGLALNIHYSSYSTQIAAEKIRQIIRSDPRPTALFVAAGDLIIAALKTAAEFGLKIPDDLALVSFDDHPLYEHFSPAITAVNQPIHDLGGEAVDLLFSLMDGKEPKEKSRILPTRIIIRGSCGGKK